MQVGIEFGRQHLEVEVHDGSLVGLRREPAAAPVADPAAAMRAALEEPLRFPPLRRALTPDDHVTVVISEPVPRLRELLPPLLEHLQSAHVAPPAVTVLCATPEGRPDWLDALPQELRGVRVEVHDPHDRRHLSYLATTRKGRRIYLNRTAVDADQVVILSRRRYDPLLGYSGSEGSLYPALSDEATQHEWLERLTMDAPGDNPWPIRQEAAEVAWLMGAPFMVQVIEGAGEEIAHVVGGVADSSLEGQRLLNARWRTAVEAPADTVVAGVSGDPAQHDFADLARAMACAARVVKPQGRIVVLSQAGPSFGPGGEILRDADSPETALRLLRKETPPDMPAAFQWANAVQQASVYLLSELPLETAEEMFVTPLEHAGQVQRLLGSNGSCLFLPDAHKMLAVPS
jgi:nickel-dependent lactate racemase